MSWISEWSIELSEQTSTTLLLDVAAKATILVFLAMLFLRLHPRGSAALRHRVWCLVFCGLMVLPALCYILPAWAIPILPSRYQEPQSVARTSEAATTSTVNDASTSAVRPTDRGVVDGMTDAAAERLRAEATIDVMEKDRRPTAVPVTARDEAVATTAAPAPPAAKASWIGALLDPFPVWLVGAALALLPLIAGMVRSAMLRAKARKIQDVSWIALRDQLCVRLRLTRAAQLLEVDAPIIPLSCGVVRPAVVLPHAARSWNECLRRFVLLHELSHIKRHDVVFQLIARLACALYWFHPLVWYAIHRLRVERELACDDSVLAAGERPSDYAEQLLEVARRLQPVRLHAAVAMAQSNNLEYRVGSLFSRARSHLPLSKWSSRLLLACAAGVVIGVSIIRPSARATGEDPSAEEQQQLTAKESAQPTENAKPQKIVGRVISPDGKAVAGAKVAVVRVQSEVNTYARKTEILAEMATDGDGRFEAPYPAELPYSGFYLFATAAGYGLTWDHAQSARAGKEYLLKLAPDDAPIEGRVVDLEGQPIAGVQVAVRSITASVENIEEWINKARNNPAQGPSIEERYSFYYRPRPEKITQFPVQDSLELDHSKLVSTTTTDATGRFRLTGLGSKRLVRLELSGTGIAKGWINAVTYPMESVPYPQVDPRYRMAKCFGARFDLAVEPEQRITGVVRDAATALPLAGVEVRLGQFANFGFGHEHFISAFTDASGRYALTGIPRSNDPESETKLRLRLIPPVEQPYFRTDIDVPISKGLDTIVRDAELKRAMWIRGRVVDEQTGKPVRAMVDYYPFLSNEAAKDYANFDPGVQGIGNDDHYATDDEGSFRIPGLPGRGIVVVVADDDTRYPRAQGADAIGGLRRQNTSEPRSVYYLLTADLVNAVREINPPAGADDFTCDVRLQPFTPHKVRLLDPDGKLLTGVFAEGLTRIPVRGLRGVPLAQPSPIVEVLGLSEDQPRHVMFTHRDRRLAAIARLTVDDFTGDTPKDITLRPTAVITGRLIDQHGAPVPEASAFTSLDVDGEEESYGFTSRWRHSRGDRAKPDGRFRIDLVPPGVKYKLQAYNSATDRGATLEIGPLKPGAHLDMGDIVLIPPTTAAEGTFPQPTRTSFADRFLIKMKPSKEDEEDVKNKKMSKPADNEKKDSEAKATTQPMELKERTINVGGQVTRPDGQPARGAHVAVIARRATVGRGGELSPDGVVLGEATADDQGRYQMSITGASSKTHRYASVIARADNTALAWRRLDLDASEIEASFDLKPAETISGRLVDIEGQPAAGVQLKVASIQPTASGESLAREGVAFWRAASLPAVWPQPDESDAQGRFSITSMPAGHGVFLSAEGSDRFAPQEIALNTGMPEQRGERDRTYRPQVVKNVKPGEDVVLTLAPAQLFTGQVTYEDTGEPAPLAHLTVWATQQGSSMLSLGGRADADGRYRINPHPGIHFGVTAYAPKGAPYVTRRIEPIPWDSGVRTKQVDVKLPRGVVVRGEVLEEGTGKPVPGASVQYKPESANNPNDRDDIVTGWQAVEAADERGRFEIVVLPGPGRLLVHGGSEFVLREISSREQYNGRPGGRRHYVHGVERIEPAAKSAPLDVTIRLLRGGKALGEIVDEEGHSTGEVLMFSRLHIHPLSPYWRGQPQELVGARFELSGLAPNREYPVHFLQPKRRIGATAMLKAGADQTRVVLEPCGEATMRFVDLKGKPIADHDPNVRFVVTPGPLDWNRNAAESETLAAEEDFIQNVDRLNQGGLKADADGRVTLPALIPGATYRVLTVHDEKLIVAKEFQAKSRETIDLGDIVFERGDQ